MNSRFYIFIVLLTFLLTLENLCPYRKRVLNKIARWPGNLFLILIDVSLIKLIFPLGLIGVAGIVKNKNLGVFQYFGVSGLYANVAMFLILDLLIYFQHYFSHKWYFLWRFHRVHHSDLDLDVTSGLRFHPIEILYSFLYKCLIVLFFGISSEVVFIFEIVLNGMAMFNHANISIPKKLERIIRIFFVTPQMHIIHHSIYKVESDMNFGFNFTLWDYFFKTYQGVFYTEGEIGDKKFKKVEDQTLKNLLLQPFK